jgi:hypothetical protein
MGGGLPETSRQPGCAQTRQLGGLLRCGGWQRRGAGRNGIPKPTRTKLDLIQLDAGASLVDALHAPIGFALLYCRFVASREEFLIKAIAAKKTQKAQRSKARIAPPFFVRNRSRESPA